MAAFRIATFVNDEAHYVAMQASFERAGFVEPVAIYERLSDRIDDPYRAITRLGAAAEPYVLVVHQDVRCDLRATAADLQRTLALLTKRDDRWAIAGNAGVNRDGFLAQLNEPNGVWRTDNLPVRVTSLDENLLILRTARHPRASQALAGFHLYGADICLNAERDKSTCYLVPFLVSHLSAGDRSGLDQAARRFGEHWGRWRPRYARTTVGQIPLRPLSFVRWLMKRGRVERRLCPWLVSSNVTRADMTDAH